MGASGWKYSVPYQADINKALQELRQNVFERGEYYKRAEFFSQFLDFLPDDLQDFVRDEIDRQSALPSPTSIAELLERNGEDGTHSIIDIETISSERGFGAASPLAKHELMDIFGTLQPTHEMVVEKEAAHALWPLRRRWEGLYIVVYRDGQPDELFFCGFSGD